jgi:16S rRNA (cytosine967-C5)-methyltransferase
LQAAALVKTPWDPNAPALADAARAVRAVAVDGRSSDAALEPFENVPHRSAVRAIALGTVRWYLRLVPAIERLLTRPGDMAPDVQALLVTAAHQIEYSRNPPEVTVHAAVDATRILGRGRASGLVNAVLRRFVTERRALLAQVDAEVPGRTAHPEWLVDALQDAWPDEYETILEANNGHPPMILRVDLARRSVAEYLSELSAAGIRAEALPWAPAAVRLEQPLAVSALPGFKEGAVSVQDAGAQLAPSLLNVQPGMRVLDACAAPGGKTAHILESCPALGELVAVDVDADRIARIQENLARLNRSAHLVVADVRNPASFWDGRPFDRILVDAPCSSTGVIRRHPDIKLLRRRKDIPQFAALQLEILRALVPLLAPGGRLVYCTCSVLPEENVRVMDRLLEAEASLRNTAPLGHGTLAPAARNQSIGVQLLPGAEAATDGFYYACLEKTTVGSRA